MEKLNVKNSFGIIVSIAMLAVICLSLFGIVVSFPKKVFVTIDSKVDLAVDHVNYVLTSNGDVVAVGCTDDIASDGAVFVREKIEINNKLYDVTTLGDYAFRSPKIKSIHIPAGVDKISRTAFVGCSDLENIQVDANNQAFETIDGVLCSGGTLIAYPKARLATKYVVPSKIDTISGRAFDGCDNLDSIELHSGVAMVENYAFYGVDNLTISLQNEEDSAEWARYWNMKAKAEFEKISVDEYYNVVVVA